MAHATTHKTTRERDGGLFYDVPVASGEVGSIFVNTVAACNSSGQLGRASNATYNRILGYIESVSADGTTAKVRRGRAIVIDNSATNAVTAAHVGQAAKIEDSQTAAAPATASLPAGGTILGLDTDGVWIFFP